MKCKRLINSLCDDLAQLTSDKNYDGKGAMCVALKIARTEQQLEIKRKLKKEWKVAKPKKKLLKGALLNQKINTIFRIYNYLTVGTCWTLMFYVAV